VASGNFARARPLPERKTERMRDLDSYRCGGRGDSSSESVASLSRLSARRFILFPPFFLSRFTCAAFPAAHLRLRKLFRKKLRGVTLRGQQLSGGRCSVSINCRQFISRAKLLAGREKGKNSLGRREFCAS